MAALGDNLTKSVISGIIEGIDGVSMREGREPIFTWDMWPTGFIGDDPHPNDPNKRFVHVKIPVLVNPPDWPWDYHAEILFWFYLYISNEKLRGHLAYYGASVSPGTISDQVLEGIMEKLPEKFGVIDNSLNSKLDSINLNAPFRHVYLLPGNQSLFTGNTYEGHVEDNVTVILVPEVKVVNEMVHEISF
jgi:hypothetical protein